jgi:hypothetical protein
LLAPRCPWVRIAIAGSRRGLISAARIRMVSRGRQMGEFITRYRLRAWDHVGGHF